MEKMAPVALFGYNRADHLEKTVAHLRANVFANETDVYLFSDAAKDDAAQPGVQAVRRVAHQISGFRSVTVIERNENWGLRRSLIDGVTTVAKEHERVIVVEDDLITAAGFLRYMNQALDFYDAHRNVGSISGYVVPYLTRRGTLRPADTFFGYRNNSWGWATWWSRWRKADFEPADWEEQLASPRSRQLLARGGSDLLGMLADSMTDRNQSWAVRWYYNCCMLEMLTLFPGHSLVNNIGFDGTGVHCGKVSPTGIERFQTELNPSTDTEYRFTLPVAVDPKLHQLAKRFWDLPWLPNSALGRMLRPAYRRVRRLYKRA